MKTGFDKKTGLPTIGNELSEDDIKDARDIARLMRTSGWRALIKYMDVGRESIIDNIKDCSASVEKRDLCGQRGAILRGWDECRTLPQRIVSRAEEFLKESPVEEESQQNEYGD